MEHQYTEPAIRKIWWLVSYPKSGNTWARFTVNAYVTGFPVDINAAFQYVTGDNQRAMFQATTQVPITELNPVYAFYLRPAMLVNFCNGPQALRNLCLKSHHARVTYDDIPLFPPRFSAGAVYIVRDPRAVAPSFARHMDVSVDRAIDLMCDNTQLIGDGQTGICHWLLSWSSHVDSWTLGNTEIPTRIVRYEDMVSDPCSAFAEILRGLGFGSPIEDRFRFALEQTNFKHLQELERSKAFRENRNGQDEWEQERALLLDEVGESFVEEQRDERDLRRQGGAAFFRRGEVEGWRNELTSDQQRRIEKAFQHTMRRHGYEPELL